MGPHHSEMLYKGYIRIPDQASILQPHGTADFCDTCVPWSTKCNAFFVNSTAQASNHSSTYLKPQGMWCAVLIFVGSIRTSVCTDEKLANPSRG